MPINQSDFVQGRATPDLFKISKPGGGCSAQRPFYKYILI